MKSAAFSKGAPSFLFNFPAHKAKRVIGTKLPPKSERFIGSGEQTCLEIPGVARGLPRTTFKIGTRPIA
jgi:hypothetical protein